VPRLPAALAAAAAMLAPLAAAPVAAAAPLNLALDAPDGRGALRTTLVPGLGLPLPPGLRLSVDGEDLALQATRRPDGTVAVEQARMGPGGPVLTPTALAARSMAAGLREVLRLRLTDRRGRVVLDRRLDLCPNHGLPWAPGSDDERATVPAFPHSCGYLLSRSVPWGIPAGRTVELGFATVVPAPLRVPTGTYRAELTVDPDGHLAQRTRADDVVRFRLRVDRRRPRRADDRLTREAEAAIRAREREEEHEHAEEGRVRPVAAPAPVPAAIRRCPTSCRCRARRSSSTATPCCSMPSWPTSAARRSSSAARSRAGAAPPSCSSATGASSVASRSARSSTRAASATATGTSATSPATDCATRPGGWSRAARRSASAS
jgi:hypothetical protein